MARVSASLKENAYKNYIADALQILTENTSKSGGRHIKNRYCDIINTKAPKKPKDTRTGEQIAADIINKIARKEALE